MEQAKIVDLGARIAELDFSDTTLVAAFDDMLDHAPRPEVPADELEALAAAGVTFDEATLLRAATAGYLELAQAWQERDASHAADRFGSELHEEIREKVAADIEAGRQHLLPGVEVHCAALTHAHVDGEGVTTVVRLHLIGRELFEDAEGNVIAGDDTYRQWEEDWTFRRDPASGDDWHAIAITRLGAAELV
jgi:predicted lipid-binding transport protein (Tim44 family)